MKNCKRKQAILKTETRVRLTLVWMIKEGFSKIVIFKLRSKNKMQSILKERKRNLL